MSDFMLKGALCALSLVVFACSVEHVGAEDESAEVQSDEERAIPPGILPIPDYGGDFWTRQYLTGDWGGIRTNLAEKGIQFDVDTVHWVDSVVSGGTNNNAKFGGNLTYNLKLDLMRAGLIPGAVIQVRAESRYGSSGILNAGQAIPLNTAALSPTNYSNIDKGYGLALSQLSYLQLFSEKIGVIGGKLDLYGDGDLNEFAGGRGRTQFSNWSLNFGTPNLFVPASTIGAGVVVLPSKNLNVTSLLLSGTECTNSNCFTNLDDKGGVSATTASYQYTIGGLPGGATGSFIYMFDKDFTRIGSLAPVAGTRGGFVTSTRSTSWIAGGSFWQYLYVEDSPEGPVDLTNKIPDHEGFGVFGRLTFADNRTNPWKTSLAFGVGGRGVVPGRPNDLFGIGYYYNELERGRVLTATGFKTQSQGVEGFYNLAITPAARLSLNAQYLPSTAPRIDDSTVVSGRLQLRF